MISMLETACNPARESRSDLRSAPHVQRLRGLRPAAGRGFFSIDGDVQGRAPPPIPDVGIRAAIQQQLGDVVMIRYRERSSAA